MINDEKQRSHYICSYSADYRPLHLKEKNSEKSQYTSISETPIIKHTETLYTDISLDKFELDKLDKDENTPDEEMKYNEKTDEKRDEKELERKYCVRFLGGFFRTSMISIILAISMSCMGVVSHFFCKGQVEERLRYYDELIWPVVMQDPEPFDINSSADEKLLLHAGIWRTAVQKNDYSSEFDSMGRLILSQVQVEEAVKELFGRSIDISKAISEDVYFYKYDTAQNRFYVESVSADQCFKPHTVDFRNDGTNIVLNVEYVVPQEQFAELSKDTYTLKAEKYMQYIIKTDPLTNNQYISEVRSIT